MGHSRSLLPLTKSLTEMKRSSCWLFLVSHWGYWNHQAAGWLLRFKFNAWLEVLEPSILVTLGWCHINVKACHFTIYSTVYLQAYPGNQKSTHPSSAFFALCAMNPPMITLPKCPVMHKMPASLHHHDIPVFMWFSSSQHYACSLSIAFYC